MTASGVAVLLDRSLLLGEEVFHAMQSRGFRGEAYTIDVFEMRVRDWMVIGVVIGLGAGAFVL
jgi:energy-coupling factor transporter transmembrane protein EcfT